MPKSNILGKKKLRGQYWEEKKCRLIILFWYGIFGNLVSSILCAFMFISYVGLSLFFSFYHFSPKKKFIFFPLNLINYIFFFVGKKFEEDNCVGKMLDNQSVQIKDNWLLLIHDKLIGSKLYFLLLLHENREWSGRSSALKRS